MTKCPFCQYDNEDGALFCEQCKSDLGVLEVSASALPPVALEQAQDATDAAIATAVPVANPVRSEDLAGAADTGPIPVARPVTRDGAPLPYAEVPTAPVAESGMESAPI